MSLLQAIKAAGGKRLSEGEELLAMQLKSEGISFEREFLFHKTRKWRFDFVIYPARGAVAVEIEGGIWNKGAHVRGKHFESDCMKYAEAAIAGWRVMRFSTGQVKDGTALNYIKVILQEKPWE